MIGFGLDLSHHQNPTAMPWETWRGVVDFVIARASYGTMRDRHVVEHLKRARGIGAKVGLYAFFRPSQQWPDQMAVLRAVARDVGLGPGDIVPAIDIEKDPVPSPGRDVAPDWEPACRAMTAAMVAEWGDALVYITQREWRMLGKPAWVLERPLWCAHYTDAAAPATPSSMPATIWQHRVDDVDRNGGGGHNTKARLQIDQNRLLRPLPLIRGAAPEAIDDATRERTNGLVALTLQQAARGELPRDDHDTDPAPPPSEEIA